MSEYVRHQTGYSLDAGEWQDGPDLWQCATCGALIGDQELHTAWHATLTQAAVGLPPRPAQGYDGFICLPCSSSDHDHCAKGVLKDGCDCAREGHPTPYDIDAALARARALDAVFVCGTHGVRSGPVRRVATRRNAVEPVCPECMNAAPSAPEEGARRYRRKTTYETPGNPDRHGT